MKTTNYNNTYKSEKEDMIFFVSLMVFVSFVLLFFQGVLPHFKGIINHYSSFATSQEPKASAEVIK